MSENGCTYAESLACDDPNCECRKDAIDPVITIPRAQLEAYKAAAFELIDWSRYYDYGKCDCADCLRRRKALVALRSAGIETGEGK